MTANDFRPIDRKKIDSLPPILKAQVIDGIMAGLPLRRVAAMAGIAFKTVARYRDSVILPRINARGSIVDQLEQTQLTQSADISTRPDTNPEIREEVILNQQTNVALVRASLVRERAESLWRRTERALNYAEQAVNIVNVDGVAVPTGKDVATWAKVLSVADKQINTQGRLSGELHAAGNSGPSVAIQVVYPAAPRARELDELPPGLKIGIKA